MNERIKQLAEQATTIEYGADFNGFDRVTFDKEKFAELIVRECCSMVNAHVQHNNPHDCLLVLDIKEHFGVEECRGWVCPKCGVDRTKDVCPQGHMAAVEGKCPMIGVAQ